jgi:hypothetical protein
VIEAETESQPREDEIAEDCVAFLRATKVVSAPRGSDCPTCSTTGTEVLRFQRIETARVSCAAARCEAHVAIHASFDPGTGENIGGGLTAWISPEQKAEYLRGHPPSGEQLYKVKITYARAGNHWRPVEFERDWDG